MNKNYILFLMVQILLLFFEFIKKIQSTFSKKVHSTHKMSCNKGKV